jgi:hypothetical protein
VTREFDPKRDGFNFENWGEQNNTDGSGYFCNGCALPAGHTGSCDFTWDLYQQTYLAISPASVADVGFYEIFKNCAQLGNCGGFSFLALALFKYGGYMGFCSPASFYTGGKPPGADAAHTKRWPDGPDGPDLHRAINILQARQFAARGILNLVEMFNANTLNDAEVAFKKVKEQLAKGDYPALWLATNTFAENAHTVIPYKAEENNPNFPGKKVLHIWNCNYPYDVNSSKYNGKDNLLVINSSFSWDYTPDPGNSNATSYHGSNIGWCFAVPMSLVLTKSRQPIALDIASKALIQIFVNVGSVSQITDEQGRRFYINDADAHVLRQEVEVDPAKRVPNLIRYPWAFRGSDQQAPGELYFMERSKSDASSLITTVSGNYELTMCMGQNLIKINSASERAARDAIKTQGLVLEPMTLEMTPTGHERSVSLSHMFGDAKAKGWRKFVFKKMTVPEKETLRLSVERKGDSHAVVLSSLEKEVAFDLEVEEQIEKKHTTQVLGRASTVPGKVLRLEPAQWGSLLSTSKLVKRVVEHV